MLDNWFLFNDNMLAFYYLDLYNLYIFNFLENLSHNKVLAIVGPSFIGLIVSPSLDQQFNELLNWVVSAHNYTWEH